MVEGMGQRSKKHHYVPRLVLRGFAKGNTIDCYDLLARRAYQLSINDGAAENDYNTIDTMHGERSDVGERAMARIEGAAAPALEAVAEPGWKPTPKDKLAIGRFLALQYVRVPHQRAFSDVIADQLMKLEMAASGPGGIEAVLARNGHDVSRDEVLRRWNEVKGFDWRVTQGTSRHVIRSLEMVDEFAPMLTGVYSWCVVHWEQRHILTGDNPLLLVRASDWPAWSGVGLGTAGRIMFGINRRCALVLVSKLEADLPDGTPLRPTVAMARGVSRRCAQAATSRIFHHPDDDVAAMLGPDFTLPIPTPVDLDHDHAVTLRTALVTMGEHAYEHPDEPHPMSGLPGSTFR